MIELTEMVENTQHFNYYKSWYLFLYIGKFDSKFVIMLVLCLVLTKKHFHQFSLSVLKWMILLILKITFCTILVITKLEFSIQSLQYWFYYACFWQTVYFKQFLLHGLRVNYSVNIETIFHIFLVVINASLNGYQTAKEN